MILPEPHEKHEIALRRVARGASVASALPATFPKQYPPIDYSYASLVFNLPPGSFVAPVLSAPYWMSGTPSFEILVRGTTVGTSVFDLYKNGAVVGTMFVASGTDTRTQFSPGVHFDISDILEIQLTTAGTGGTACTIKLS